jgi:MerR family redox-sensitive transcriptional activator SoxR
MALMMIGDVARQTGLRTSALRFYERCGLIAPPPRAAKRRQYDPKILGRIRLIILARNAGFTLSEVRTFLSNFPTGTTPAMRWRAMAARKLQELDAQAARITQMKSILEAAFHCECRRLEDCEKLLAARERPARNSSARRRP